MSKIIVVYHSGYGHTARIAQEVATGAEAELLAIDAEGNLPEGGWEKLAEASAIIFGSPTYMGGPSWQFKKFADASSKVWFVHAWKDKLFGGFTVSASLNGDKGPTMIQLHTLASQHGGIWVSLGMAPANDSAATRANVNNLGGSIGLLVQCASDAGAEAIPTGDIETANKYGHRIKEIAARLK